MVSKKLKIINPFVCIIITGLEESIGHLEDVGAKVLYLNSIFKDRNGTSQDVGYDIVDFMDVDMSLGSIEDFDALVTAATEKG